MATIEVTGDDAVHMTMIRPKAEDPSVYSVPDQLRFDAKWKLAGVYNEVAERIEREAVFDVVRVKNTSGGAWTAPYLLYLADSKLTTQTTDTASNSPSPGASVVYNVTATFEVGQIVTVVSGGFTEYSRVTAISAGVSVTLHQVLWSHTTPTITALPAYEATGAINTGDEPAEWVTSADISNNAYGWAYGRKSVTGFNAAAYTDEKLVYLNSTIGTFTETEPTAIDQFTQVVGVVRDGSNPGTIDFFPGAKRILRINTAMGAGAGTEIVEHNMLAWRIFG